MLFKQFKGKRLIFLREGTIANHISKHYCR